MSTMTAKASQAAAKAKAERLCGMSNTQKPFYPQGENASDKTGMAPVSKQHLKKGGKVVAGKIAGSATAKRADRPGRKAGGRIASEIANTDVKAANKSRPGGKAHVGGMKKGGKVKKAMGGLSTGRDGESIGRNPVAEMRDVQKYKADSAMANGGVGGLFASTMRKDGGKVPAPKDEDAEKPSSRKKYYLVEAEDDEPEHAHEDEHESSDEVSETSAMRKGGRVKKNGGGALMAGGPKKTAKAKTKGAINIIIAGNPNAAPAGPAMVPPPMVPGPRALPPVASPAEGPNPPPPEGAMPMPPMSGPMPPPTGPMPAMDPRMMRKAGGRVDSYAAMKAGSGSGLGRLHKQGMK